MSGDRDERHKDVFTTSDIGLIMILLLDCRKYKIVPCILLFSFAMETIFYWWKQFKKDFAIESH